MLPDHRINTCLRRMRPLQGGVKILKSHEKAHYSGLMVCGSVWCCPVCAAKISERRNAELVQSVNSWRAKGGSVLMLTQTVPHYAFQALSLVLGGFGKARKLMRHRKPWKRLAKRIGLIGTIRALEVTYGENGWHVHVHELLFLEPGFEVFLTGIEGEILKMWQDACESAGLDRPNMRGIQLQDGTYAARYAGKWGVEDELTKAHLKRGRDGNIGPWDMLRMAGAGGTAIAPLFREYAEAFRGKRQLVWSEGLRDLLGLGVQVSDEELANQIEEEAVLLGTLKEYQWRIVLHADRRGELLEVAAAEGWPGVIAYIRGLVKAGHGAAPF
jgi:hypothetical protein